MAIPFTTSVPGTSAVVSALRLSVRDRRSDDRGTLSPRCLPIVWSPGKTRALRLADLRIRQTNPIRPLASRSTTMSTISGNHLAHGTRRQTNPTAAAGRNARPPSTTLPQICKTNPIRPRVTPGVRQTNPTDFARPNSPDLAPLRDLPNLQNEPNLPGASGRSPNEPNTLLLAFAILQNKPNPAPSAVAKPTQRTSLAGIPPALRATPRFAGFAKQTQSALPPADVAKRTQPTSHRIRTRAGSLLRSQPLLPPG